MSKTRRTLLAIVSSAAIAACGGPDRGATYVHAFAEGERAEHAGRYDEAGARYEAAAGSANLPRDRDHARYLSALMLARAGNAHDAAARLHVIADASPPTEDSAEASYKLAELALTSGNEADGWRQMETFVLHFPGSGVAPRALRRILRHDEDTGDKRAALDHLRRLQPSLDKTDLGELVAYEIARRIGDLGDPAASRDALMAVATRWPYPYGALWDDALYHASELDESLGHYDQAVRDLEQMLVERETSHFVGTYNRPLYTPALVRIGVLYRDRLHDRPHARAAFHRLFSEFDTSPNRDDALWEEAQLFEDDGDKDDACARLRTLVSTFPDSRYVPCAAEQCAIPRDPKSASPKTCHPYIKRARYGQPRTASE